jgi:hypothetical protein
MHNRSRILASQQSNMKFQSVFALNWCFSVKPIKNYIRTIMYNRSVIYASRPRNMEFQLVFATNWRFFGKSEG